MNGVREGEEMWLGNNTQSSFIRKINEKDRQVENIFNKYNRSTVETTYTYRLKICQKQ